MDASSFSYTIVIVTYNRLNMLKICLEHALLQTVRPESIVIVDNASTDGTGEYLTEIESKASAGSYDSELIIYREDENIGGAGGFHDGIKTAMERTKAEWILVIDDDAILDYDCCGKMNPALYIKETGGGAAPAYACAVYYKGELELNHRVYERRIIPAEEYKKRTFECTRTSFCGSMFSRSLIEKTGYPLREYFLWSDDTEFSLRIAPHGKIVVCTEATLQHGDPNAPDRRAVADWRYYYGTRNRIDMLRRHRKHYELMLMVAEIRLIILLRMIRIVIHRSDKDRQARDKYEKAVFRDGLKDGLQGKLGKNPDYLPGVRKN